MRALTILLLGCQGRGGADTAGPTVQGPTLAHIPPEVSLQEGDSVDLGVIATDDDGVAEVVVLYRTTGGEYWESAPLEDQGDDTWGTTLTDLPAPGLDYYFRGTDASDAAVNAYLPVDGATAPFTLTVGVHTTAPPYTEDFDGDATTLYGLGWWSPSLGFGGYPFELTDALASSGTHSAVHPRGYTGVGDIDDWLISPALDFSAGAPQQVSWTEYVAAADEAQAHGLYVSTGARDPSEGDFQPVTETLPIPADRTWAPSAAYDLSEWAGEPVVYLAWRWQGEYADDWYIDDIQVRDLAPSFSASVSWAPDPVHPGEAATLTAVLSNGADKDAEGLVATLSLPDGGATIEDDTVDVGDVAAGGMAQASFVLDLDASLHDNRALPLDLSLTDGVDTWDFDLQMIVGQPSTATVSLSLDEATNLQVTLGLGDPDDPDLELPVFADLVDGGDLEITADITDQYELLPPEAGPSRWFARVQAGAAGTIDGFSVDYGEQTWFNEHQVALVADSPADIYLPRPPAPVLDDSSPSSVTPGQQAVALSLTLTNDGADTVGPVTGTLVAGDGVSVDSGASFTVDADTWEDGETHEITGPLLSVSADHVDSTPVQLSLELSDGVDDWTIPVSLDVPWPVLRVTRVTIDDDGGDGILDPDEAASVEIELVNAGDLDPYDTIEGTLSVESTSTASASVSADSERFGDLSVGRSRDASYDVQVDSGVAGDTLDLLLSLEDGSASYSSRVQLVLGEPPWFLLATSDDPVGDNLDGYDFDFTNAWYRVTDGVFELRMASAVEIDPSTLFIEIWGDSPGADYTWYRWVLQAGTATLQGYDATSGFSSISTLTASFPDDNTVQLSWPLDDLGLAIDSLGLGLAAGWCGPDEYYCDHFPDGWGYPYDSFSSGMFFDAEW